MLVFPLSLMGMGRFLVWKKKRATILKESNTCLGKRKICTNLKEINKKYQQTTETTESTNQPTSRGEQRHNKQLEALSQGCQLSLN
jgi:hypothetical protein